jgi:hypothetical protein
MEKPDLFGRTLRDAYDGIGLPDGERLEQAASAPIDSRKSLGGAPVSDIVNSEHALYMSRQEYR